jgi:hypothetical protein
MKDARLNEETGRLDVGKRAELDRNVPTAWRMPGTCRMATRPARADTMGSMGAFGG